MSSDINTKGKMSPRERIITALDHRQPDRVPFSWGFCATPEMIKVLEGYYLEKGIDWQKLRSVTNDKNGAGAEYIGPVPANGNTYSGIWGINLKNVDYGTGEYAEFTDFPLGGVEDVRFLDDYPWPSCENYNYSTLRQRITDADPNRNKAVQCAGGNPFEIYCWMTGLEEAMMNLLINPELVIKALDYITSFFAGRLRRELQEVGDLIDLVFLADDLGSQTGLLMSRDAYRGVIQPFHRRITDTVKECAPHAKVLFHSDGAVFDIIPDLIDAGIDVLEAVQTDADGMDPAQLKSEYGQQIGFHGAISVQDLLPHKDMETVARECRRMVEILGAQGGYIAAPAHAIQMGTPPENVDIMLQTILGEADYQDAIEKSRP